MACKPRLLALVQACVRRAEAVLSAQNTAQLFAVFFGFSDSCRPSSTVMGLIAIIVRREIERRGAFHVQTLPSVALVCGALVPVRTAQIQDELMVRRQRVR